MDNGKYWIVRVVGAILLLAGIAAIAFAAYQTGLTQGQAAVPAVQEAPPINGAAWGMHFHPLFFSPFLICLAPFLLCLFIFFPLRLLLGPRRMHPMHMHWHRPFFGEEGGVPSPIAEWHRRLHEDKPQDK